MIPKILHSIWIGPRPPPMDLIRGWTKAHPTWDHRLWRDDTLFRYVDLRTGYESPFAPRWSNGTKIREMGEWNGKADIMRFSILARYGGIYIDADEECLLPLDSPGADFREHEAFASWESEIATPGLVATTVLGGVPGAALFRELEREIAKRAMSYPAWKSVGPGLLTEVAARHPKLHVYPSRAFLPWHHSGVAAPGNFPAYGNHHWGSTLPGTYERISQGALAFPFSSGAPG
jgi:mannosyltransferase OCH1-like enzyme